MNPLIAYTGTSECAISACEVLWGITMGEGCAASKMVCLLLSTRLPRFCAKAPHSKYTIPSLSLLRTLRRV